MFYIHIWIFCLIANLSIMSSNVYIYLKACQTLCPHSSDTFRSIWSSSVTSIDNDAGSVATLITDELQIERNLPDD